MHKMKCSILWEYSVLSTTPVKPMARLLCFALIIAVSALMCVLAEEERYSDKYDNVDAQAILNNKDMRDAFYNCFMDRTKCQSDVEKFAAGIFSEAYTTNCKKCTEKLKENFKITIDWYMKNDPDKWKLALEKIQEEMKAN